MIDASKQVVQTLRDAGYEALWAGGSVRDRLLGRSCKDIDIATSATPDQVLAEFDHTHEIGKAFGVVQVIVGGFEFEIATFRRDLEYTDGRHPSGIEPSDAKEDAQRRDFTINGMFFDPVTEEVIDYVGGRADIDAKQIRAIGDPVERFAEDHLRMLRAIRFAQTLDFSIEPETWAAIQTHAHLVKGVSAERIENELSRIWLEAKQPGTALRMLLDSGLLEYVLPEAMAMHGCEQPPQYHPEGDVFIHTELMLNFMEERSLQLAWAILFHDMAKPDVATVTIEDDGSERIRFNGHDTVGATKADEVMKRLKFSNADREAIKTAVANHMKYYRVKEMRKNTLRKLVGSPTFDLEMELHRIDCASIGRATENWQFLKEFEASFAAEPVLPEPLVSGRDVMAIGVPPGREVGVWKMAAYDRQLEDKSETQAQLLAWIQSERAAQVNPSGE